MKDINILNIKLVGFKGFKTSNIKEADITTTKKLQILNSSGGSGKSKFLSEYSLSVINKDMFNEGGSKQVTFSVEGATYIFKSGLKGHTLKTEDGKVLTQGNTATAYAELVEQMFGYTPYKWKLVTGQISFVGLGKSDRQSWIEAISGIDFDFPFKLYGKIRGRITGIRRAIKEYDAEMVSSNSRVLSEAVRDIRTARKGTLGKLISKIIESKDGTPSKDTIRGKIDKYIALDNCLEIHKGMFLNGSNSNFQYLNVRNIDEFRDKHLSANSELDLIDVKFDNASRELKEKIKLRDELSTMDEFDIDAAKEILAERKAELEEASDMVRGVFNDCDVHELKTAFANMEETLFQINLSSQNAITTGLEHEIGADKRIKLAKNLKEDNILLSNLNNEIAHIEDIIRDTNAGKDITCPNCSAIFKDGSSSISVLTTKLNDLNDRVDILKVVIERNSEVVSEIACIDSDINALGVILKRYIPYAPIRRRAIDALDGKSSLGDVIGIVKEDLMTAGEQFRVMSLTKEVSELGSTIAHNERLSKLGSSKDYVNQCDHLEQVLVDIREERIAKMAKIKSMASDGKKLVAYIKSVDKFNDLIKKHHDALMDLQNTIYASAVGTLLDDLQVELGKISGELIDDSINVGIRDKLSGLLTSNRDTLTILMDLERAINPSTGLIAEQLAVYCKLFSGCTSDILAQIWEYEMIVHDPVIHPTRGVNYKFPLTVVDDDLIPDISDGSTSQKSIIDLAVVLASRELMGASSQPLILDEVGGGFDTVHNINLGEFLYELIRDSNSSNVLVIHHDATVRAMLGDCDTIVFDPDNVVLEPDYNEHVKLTYN